MKSLLDLTKTGIADRNRTADLNQGIKPIAFLLTGLVIATKAQLIFEIGSGYLLTAQAFLHGLEITGGSLISCDRKKRFGTFSHPQFTFVLASSNEVAKTWVSKIDILLIDGSHKYSQTKLDYETFSPFVKSGGLILIHDTSLCPGATKVANEIKLRKIDLKEFPGITIFQKE